MKHKLNYTNLLLLVYEKVRKLFWILKTATLQLLSGIERVSKESGSRREEDEVVHKKKALLASWYQRP